MLPSAITSARTADEASTHEITAPPALNLLADGAAAGGWQQQCMTRVGN